MRGLLPLAVIHVALGVLGGCWSSSFYYHCHTADEIKEETKSGITLESLKFAQATFGGDASAAFDQLTAEAQKDISREQLTQIVETLKASGPYEALHVERLMTVTGYGHMPQQTVVADCAKDTSLTESNVRVTISNVPEQAYALVSGKGSTENWTATLWMVPVSGRWQIQSFQFNMSTAAGKSADEFLAIARQQSAKGHTWGQYKYLFQLARATGMRSGELFGLRVEDLDLEHAIVHVRRSVWGHLEVTPKTDAGFRDVDIDAQTVRMLKEHLGDQKTGLVFSSRNNTPLVNRNINVHVLRVICKRLEIPNGGMHAFRHGRISELQAKGVPGDLITRWVGHVNLKITSLYTHFTDEFRKETIARLDPKTQVASTASIAV
jgi:Phage integrase family